jgi:GNAT superfamily N-acetyltransferase
MNGRFTVRQVIQLPDDFPVLYRVAIEDGFRAIGRLKSDWESGANRFDQPGEAFFEARHDGELVGVCGLNRDPFARDKIVGRLRRMFVMPAARRRGVGQLLVAKALQHALGEFEVVRLRTDSQAADEFYRALGFKRIEGDDDATHELVLKGWTGGRRGDIMSRPQPDVP